MSTQEDADKNKTDKRVSFDSENVAIDHQPRTNYFESLANLFKANVGTGCFAMADAIRNSGILLGPIATVIIATICIHCFHVLVQCADYIMLANNMTSRPDYAETVELSFLLSKREKWRKAAKIVRKICNICICLTQFGFCAVYLVFVGRSTKLILDHYGILLDVKIVVTIIFIPIWISTLLRKLKHIALFSAVANFCMILGTCFTIGYAVQDLPSIEERPYYNIQELPLFFGTALFAFTGIAVVLPLMNAMEKPQQFASFFGVLNVGMVLTSIIYVGIGVIGYWHYGEDTQASITLNLPINQILAQVIIAMVAFGVASTVAIQFYVAIQIMFPSVSQHDWARSNPILAEELFRTFWMLIIFVVAQVVPNLGLLLSFIGAGCCTAIVFVFPVISELIIKSNRVEGIGKWIWTKNIIILVISFIGGIMGMALAIIQLVEEYKPRNVEITSTISPSDLMH